MLALTLLIGFPLKFYSAVDVLCSNLFSYHIKHMYKNAWVSCVSFAVLPAVFCHNNWKTQLISQLYILFPANRCTVTIELNLQYNCYYTVYVTKC
jgi:hypothetical protein